MHVCIIYTSYPTPDKDVRQIRPELHEGFRKRRKGFASFQRQTPPHPRRFFRRRRYRGSARRAPTDSHKEETRGRQIATMAGATVETPRGANGDVPVEVVYPTLAPSMSLCLVRVWRFLPECHDRWSS